MDAPGYLQADAFRYQPTRRALAWVGAKPRFIGVMLNATGWAYRRTAERHGLWRRW